MPRTERQRRMLDAMGIRVFEPEVAHPAPQAATPKLAPKLAGAAAVVSRSNTGHTADSPVPTMDWATLQSTVANCRACKLCESRTQTVFGVGNVQAHWMIVGEAPGESEDLQGEPFVGASGQLLDAMLKALGLTRAEAPPHQQVYIANTLKCRPPRNRNPTARRAADVRAVLAAPDQTGGAARDPGHGPFCRSISASLRRSRGPTAGPRAPHRRRPAGGHLPPSLLASQPDRQSARVGRPLFGG